MKTPEGTVMEPGSGALVYEGGVCQWQSRPESTVGWKGSGGAWVEGVCGCLYSPGHQKESSWAERGVTGGWEGMCLCYKMREEAMRPGRLRIRLWREWAGIGERHEEGLEGSEEWCGWASAFEGMEWGRLYCPWFPWSPQDIGAPESGKDWA